MYKFKVTKRWFIKHLPIAIACASMFAFNPLVANADSGVVNGAGDEESNEDIEGGRVEVDGGSVDEAIGGVSATGNVEDSTVEINGGQVEGAVGGVTIVNEEAENVAGNVVGNEVIVNGGTVNYVSGGEVGYMYPRDGDGVPDTSKDYLQSGGDVIGNKVAINGGTINGAVVGGSALTGSANDNSVDISGGTISGSVIGGMVRYPTARSTATGNTITLRLSDETDPNSGPALYNVDLIGGMLGDGEGGWTYTSSGNTLNINGLSDLNVRSINGLDRIDFQLPTTGDTVLNNTAGASTDLDGMTNSVGARGDNARIKNITEGNELTISLIQNNNGINGLDTIELPDAFKQGNLIERELDLYDDAGNPIASNHGENLVTSAALDGTDSSSSTGIRAKVGKIIEFKPGPLPPPPIPLPKTYPEPLTLPEDTFREIQDEDAEIDNEMKIFAGIRGSSLRTKFSDGGHINNKHIGLGVGGSKTIVSKQNGSRLCFAPIIDHGKGKYDNYTADGRHGNGDTQFDAGGFIARRMLPNGFYYEGSLRYGRARSTFESNDFDEDDLHNTYASYSASAPIFIGHINIGKLFAINRENTVHVYGQYLHAHQGSMAADLSDGHHYVFDSVNDGTFVAGIRFINQPNRVNKFYSGFAYQYDHSSGSSAVCEGQSTHEVDSNGGSGMFELGWELKPHDAIPWVIDLGAIGWIGQQKGLTFHAKVKKSF